MFLLFAHNSFNTKINSNSEIWKHVFFAGASDFVQALLCGIGWTPAPCTPSSLCSDAEEALGVPGGGAIASEEMAQSLHRSVNWFSSENLQKWTPRSVGFVELADQSPQAECKYSGWAPINDWEIGPSYGFQCQARLGTKTSWWEDVWEHIEWKQVSWQIMATWFLHAKFMKSTLALQALPSASSLVAQPCPLFKNALDAAY